MVNMYKSEVSKNDAFQKLCAVFLSLAAVVYTFYYSEIHIDKFIGFFLVFLTIFFFLGTRNGLRLIFKKPNDTLIFFLGLGLLILIYLFQAIKYEIIFNVEIFTIITFYCTPALFNLTKDKFNYLFLMKCLGVLLFIFVILNTVTISYGKISIFWPGISSFVAYLCFVIFWLFFTSNKFLLAASAFFVIALQRRILILSLFFILIRRGKFTISTLITGLGIVGLILLVLFFIYPESRIFQTHTSGRSVHWGAIFSAFEMDNVFFGMGGGASYQFLVDLGVSRTMGRAHNEFLTYFYDLGILGIICLFGGLKLIYSSCSSKGRVILFTIIMQMFTDNIFTYYANYLLPLILCLLVEGYIFSRENPPARDQMSEENVISNKGS